MITKPKVSVIVPIYNVEKYINRCLQSIVNQTLFDIEIILVDDGSTDSSGKICDEYASKESRIQVIHKTNEGYGKAVNTGFSIARGEYLGIIESDDFIKPEMFEQLYLKAIAHNADIAKSNFLRYWSKPIETTQIANILKSFPKDKSISPKDYPLLYTTMPSIWSAIYKTNYIRENNISFLETPGASYQDVSFHFKTLLYARNVVLVNNAYLYYRQDNESSSINSKGKVFCICTECAEIERTLKNTYPHNKQLWFIEEKFKFDKYIWNFWRLRSDFRQMFAQHFKNEFQENNILFSTNTYLTKFEKFIITWIIKDPNGFIKISNMPFSKSRMIFAKIISKLGLTTNSRLTAKLIYMQQNKGQEMSKK